MATDMKIIGATRRVASARVVILSIVILTALNFIMLLSQSDLYFLYSASVPYILTFLAMVACGVFPPEYYGGNYPYMDFLPNSYFIMAIIFSIIIVGLYLLCFFMSKKYRTSWLIVALVLFALDTLFMLCAYLFLEYTSGIIDVVFHVIILVSLAMGVHGSCQLSKAEKAGANPTDPSTQINLDVTALTSTDTSSTPSSPYMDKPDSTILRVADMEVKSRVFFKEEIYGHTLIFRRVKRVNELIIDGNVYAEYVALMERSHLLSAIIDGHEYAAGADTMTSSVFIMVDGIMVKSKVRLI